MFKESLLQGTGWVCLKINLVACRGRDCPSRSHSEGLTSHRSYGRTGRRRRLAGSSEPAASIEQKVSRQTWAKDHDGCISHHMSTSQVWSRINQISQEKTERARPWELGRPARHQTSAWVPPSLLRPTRTPTSSTRASTSSTSASCLLTAVEARLLSTQCCSRCQTILFSH